ncbi:ATP-binding protein [Amycolatopsis pigmentata]|uniref:ATP-binding protein n=1 Tax=Amycolatopsis pigmentata TaxID=450801 RepID=A0ABW5FPR0_9PSEU
MSGGSPGAGTLAARSTSFVGRRRELAEVRRLLGSARLVTLSGPGGVGKTRLAAVAAEATRGSFQDGVWFVRLGDLRDPALVPSAVASALGLAETVEEPAAALAGYFSGKRLLLVLDDCEHVLEATAVLVAGLLESAEELRVLATSTQLLRIRGERVLTVPPLSVSNAGESDESDAVTLFADRAAAVRPDFRVDAGNRETVFRICRRLDGIPLALELAAVQLRRFSLEEILRRLDDRFALLTAGAANTPFRQRTLEATIAWSYELCTPAERAVWVAVSVFDGNFGLEAAEAVCGGFGIAAGEVLDLVAGLLDKSIIARVGGTEGHTVLYSMLETTREYGQLRLKMSGREEAVRDRHAGYWVRLAQRYRQEEFSSSQREWIDRLRGALPNLRGALRYAIDRPDRGYRPAEIAAPLRQFWFAGGLLAEGAHWLRAALESEPEPTPLRAEALRAAVEIMTTGGALDKARGLLAELRELTVTLDDDLLRARYAMAASMVAYFDGDLEKSRALAEQALVGFRRAGDPMEVNGILSLLSSALFYLNDPAGEQVAEEALALAETHHATWSRTYALWTLGLHVWRRGDYRRSEALLREVVAARLPDYGLLNLAINGLAWSAGALGRHQQAAGLLGAAHAVLHASESRIAATNAYWSFDRDCRQAAEKALGAETFAEAFAATSRLSVEEAIAYVLAEKPEPRTPSRRPHSTQPGGLTRRELEIAEMVTEGLSNKQIAARLVITQRTVETHVENILTKLGFTSRAQIAAWLTKRKVAVDSEKQPFRLSAPGSAPPT